MTIIAGFDVSSTTIGYSVIQTAANPTDPPKVIICSSFHPLDDTHGLMERLTDTQSRITDILDRYGPDEIAIEAIVQFMQGNSGAKTIIALARFNSAVGLVCYAHLGREPQFHSVMSIRHGIKDGKGLPDKLDIPELCARRLGITFPYQLVEKGKHAGKIATSSYDAADSLAVTLYEHLRLTQQLKSQQPKAKRAKKTQ